QLRVQLKAAARQGLERRPITPIPREKATGLAGGGTGDAGALDDDGLDAATAQEIGGGGTDDTATTDDNPHARLQAACDTGRPKVRVTANLAPVGPPVQRQASRGAAEVRTGPSTHRPPRS